MTARVLVVDDILANVKLLEARLRAEYFDVLIAGSGAEALEICDREEVDVVLLDVMMPGMDGFEVCRRLKANPKTRMTPVVMVTALDQSSDRIQGFEAGADDFLTKPVNDVALVTRVKNLARMKQLTDELVMRVTKADQDIISADLVDDIGAKGANGLLLLVDEPQASTRRLMEALESEHLVEFVSTEKQAFEVLAHSDVDLAVVNLRMREIDGLRLCSTIRSNSETRHLPVLVLGEAGDEPRMMRALDLGVNDYVMRPVDRNELLARVRVQIKRRRYSDYLSRRLEERVEQAAHDPMTGMYNRRYLDEHMHGYVTETLQNESELSVITLDIDHFKQVNDKYGHDAGDQVIRQFSARILQNIRRVDLAFRVGGEEFLVILPKTSRERAELVGERLRGVIEGSGFRIGDDEVGNISITTSIGLTSFASQKDSIGMLLKRADEALYEAKRTGRNRVVSRAAA